MKIGPLRFSNVCGYNCLINDLEVWCRKIWDFLCIYIQITTLNIYLLFRKGKLCLNAMSKEFYYGENIQLLG